MARGYHPSGAWRLKRTNLSTVGRLWEECHGDISGEHVIVTVTAKDDSVAAYDPYNGRYRPREPMASTIGLQIQVHTHMDLDQLSSAIAEASGLLLGQAGLLTGRTVLVEARKNGKGGKQPVYIFQSHPELYS